jgi:hypothetical protein
MGELPTTCESCALGCIGFMKAALGTRFDPDFFLPDFLPEDFLAVLFLPPDFFLPELFFLVAIASPGDFERGACHGDASRVSRAR